MGSVPLESRRATTVVDLGDPRVRDRLRREAEEAVRAALRRRTARHQTVLR